MAERIVLSHSSLRYGAKLFQIPQQESADDSSQFRAFGMLTLPDGIGKAIQEESGQIG